jgi:GT2 family glycosyltransferase
VSPRPAVDVVIPFGGREVAPVVARAAALEVREGDSVTVVDNRGRRSGGAERGGAAARSGAVAVVRADAVHSSYFARNAGARAGAAPWILFLDADVLPPPDLLDRLLDPLPDERVAVVAAEVEDEPARPGDPLAVRYAHAARSMSQGGNLRMGFVATACCAVRREAFEAVGGFREDVRSGGDADLCFRLRAAGWELALREDVVVTHRSRRSLVRMLAQRARHGSGAAWMAREHRGSFPARSLAGVAWWAVRTRSLDAVAVLAFELGRRLLPNRVQRR